MKKNLFFLLALAAFALVGCEDPNKPEQPDDTQDEITSIRFESEEVKISMDDVRGVKLILFPTVEATFTTSDDAIVTVDETGRIFPVAEGTAVITAKYEELVAECTVTVLGSIYDIVKWAGFDLLEIDKTTVFWSDSIELTDDGINYYKYNCDIVQSVWLLMGEGLYFTNQGYLAGAGYASMFEMPIYICNDERFPKEKGYYINASSIAIVTNPDSVGTYCALGGQFVNFETYAQAMDEIYFQEKYNVDTTGISAALDALYSSYEGTSICYIDVNQDIQTVDLGFIKEGYIIQTDIDGDKVQDFQYILYVEWFDGAYGIAVDDDNNIILPYSYVAILKEYVEWDLMSGLQGGAGAAPRMQKRAIKPEMKAFKPMKALPTTKRVIR